MQVSNLGGVDSDPGVQVALYSVEAGVETLIEVQSLVLAVPSGRSTDALLFTLTRDQVGSDGLVVRVDDDGAATGAQNECDESTNEDTWAEWPC